MQSGNWAVRCGEKWCKQCKRNLDEAAFLPAKKRGWRVVICGSCAAANMAKWAGKSLVGKKVEDYQGLK